MIKPELQVQIQVQTYLNNMGFDCDLYESKASLTTRGYAKNKSLVEGHSDIAGCDENGHAIYIELKAKGKLSTLRPKQKLFLTRKINSNAFAVCVDSVEMLNDLYLKWLQISDKKTFLLNHLNRKHS